MTVEYPTRGEIRSRCTEQSFERGVNYWDRGQRQELHIDDEEIRATVRGTHNYDISIDVEDDAIHTFCSCPYDYAGDCKHVVAVLLAVDDRDINVGSKTADESNGRSTKTTDVETLVEETTVDELRTFLLDLIEDDRDVQDRFVAFAGEDTGKTVYDYKQEIDGLFANAAGRRGMVEYDTRIDFSQYHDLAATHRERGHIDSATGIYRALAETIRENINRIDDSSGHYGRELERAVESYAETVVEQDLDHEEKRPYIEYLFEEFVGAEYHFVSEDYDDALRTLCTTRADLEYWLELLGTHMSGISIGSGSFEKRATGASGQDGNAEAIEDTSESTIQTDEETKTDHERTGDVLYTSDFTEGPLTIDDFTGGAIDVEHLAVGPLELKYFTGDIFGELRVDKPTTVESHTIDFERTRSDSTEIAVSSSLRSQNVLSTCIYLLEELGQEDSLSTLYEETYLEHSRFCKQYAERLIDQGDEEHAIKVVEDGIETFGSPISLRWLAADLYQDRNPDEYRETLRRLFLDYTEWSAYDELKDACDS